MIHRRNVLGALVALAATALAGPALGQMGPSAYEPVPIAVADFYSASEAGRLHGSDLARTVTAELARATHLFLLPVTAFPQEPADMQVRPRFRDWEALATFALVTGIVTEQADGRWRVEVRLWDVGAQRQVYTAAFTSTLEGLPGLGERIARDVRARMPLPLRTNGACAVVQCAI